MSTPAGAAPATSAGTPVGAAAPAAPAAHGGLPRATSLLLNVAHAFDHLFLLVFATAVGAIATEFRFARWEDLMPYGAGAFVMFGLGSLPAGRLGDLWGRRRMMLVFFFGIGTASLLAALSSNAWQLAAALTLVGTFASIYHPVGIPMLVRHAKNPGFTIGANGLAGNLGVAAAAIVTGFVVEHAGWRAAFVVPALACFAVGALFAWIAPEEPEAPAARRGGAASVPRDQVARILLVMTVAAAVSGIVFNLTTNGNGQLLAARMRGVVDDPSTLGTLLAVVYAVASLAQLVVGRLIDRVPLKQLYLGVLLAQVPAFAMVGLLDGWWLYAALLAMMTLVFGAVPFTDAMIVRFVDDSMRSRVAGVRLAVSIGLGSLAVWLLGPVVKTAGFGTLMATMAALAGAAALVMLWMPGGTSAARSGPAGADVSGRAGPGAARRAPGTPHRA